MTSLWQNCLSNSAACSPAVIQLQASAAPAAMLCTPAALSINHEMTHSTFAAMTLSRALLRLNQELAPLLLASLLRPPCSKSFYRSRDESPVEQDAMTHYPRWLRLQPWLLCQAPLRPHQNQYLSYLLPLL